MSSTYIHTVVLPPVACSGHVLNFFCDLRREQAMEELLATLDLWLDWDAAPFACAEPMSEDAAYDLASQQMRARLTALQSKSYLAHCLARVCGELAERSLFPEVLAAFNEHFGQHHARQHQELEPTPARLH